MRVLYPFAELIGSIFCLSYYIIYVCDYYQAGPKAVAEAPENDCSAFPSILTLKSAKNRTDASKLP